MNILRTQGIVRSFGGIESPTLNRWIAWDAFGILLDTSRPGLGDS